MANVHMIVIYAFWHDPVYRMSYWLVLPYTSHKVRPRSRLERPEEARTVDETVVRIVSAKQHVITTVQLVRLPYVSSPLDMETNQ